MWLGVQQGFGRSEPPKGRTSQPRLSDHGTEPWSSQHSTGLLFGSFLQSKETGWRREVSGFPVAPATDDHEQLPWPEATQTHSLSQEDSGPHGAERKLWEVSSCWRLQGGAVFSPLPVSKGHGPQTLAHVIASHTLHLLSREDTGPTWIIHDPLTISRSLITQRSSGHVRPHSHGFWGPTRGHLRGAVIRPTTGTGPPSQAVRGTCAHVWLSRSSTNRAGQTLVSCPSTGSVRRQPACVWSGHIGRGAHEGMIEEAGVAVLPQGQFSPKFSPQARMGRPRACAPSQLLSESGWRAAGPVPLPQGSASQLKSSQGRARRVISKTCGRE